MTVVQQQRLELAHELVDDIHFLDVRMNHSRFRICEAVTASATTLTDIFGVGPIIAGMLIGYAVTSPASPPPAAHDAKRGAH